MDEDPLTHYELVYLLGLSWQHLLTTFVDRLDSAGYDDLRPVHGFALQVIAHTPDVTSSQVGDVLGVTKQAAGQLVDHLVGAGYVERADHPLGGRRRRILLTARGLRHLRDAGRTLAEVEAEVGAPVGPERMAALRADLIAMIRTGVPVPVVPALRPVW